MRMDVYHILDATVCESRLFRNRCVVKSTIPLTRRLSWRICNSEGMTVALPEIRDFEMTVEHDKSMNFTSQDFYLKM